MKLKKIKMWLLYAALFLTISTIGTIIFINYELKRMYGGHTEVVDSAQFKYSNKTTAVINANILLTDSITFVKKQTVLIDQGKIISIGEKIELPKQVQIIDAQGKFLIPGLIDSHVHLFQSPNDLLLYVANGVTSVREMTGSSKHLKWREEISNGRRIGPDLFITSPKLNTHYGTFEGWFVTWTQPVINIKNPDKAESIVQLLVDDGYDAIKLGSLISKENYKALNAATEQVGVPEIGHLPMSVELNDLWNSNQEELAHIEEIIKSLIREFGNVTMRNKDEFLRFVQERGIEVSDNLKQKEIAVTSTLWLSESFVRQKFKLEQLLREIELNYANPGLAEGTIMTSRALGWLPDVNPYRLYPDISEKDLKNIENFWTAYAQAHQILLEIMSEKGIKILAGTDSSVSAVVPGFSLHNELESLNNTGMTPSQVIDAATALPAKWMKKNTGKIEIGYDADLVLLKENPLEDIRNTKAIEWVILKGKVFYRNELDAMLKAVIEANNQSRKIDISSYQH